jgi:hypothetical protein
MNESETRTTETTVTQTATPVPTTPVTETVVTEYPNRYARNDPGSFAAGEETTPEQDEADRKEHLGTFAAGEETTPDKDAAERTHPGTFGDTEPTPLT